MRKKFDAKSIMEKIVHSGNSKFYETESNEIYMSYGPQPKKGAFLMSASNLDPIIISVAKMPLSAGQKEVVRQLIVDKAQKLAVKQQVFNRVGFKGGKAVATTIGILIPLAFWPLLCSIALCILAIWRSGFVSLGSLVLVTAMPILLLFGASENTIGYAYDYMRVIISGIAISHLFFGLNSQMRSMGHPKTAMSFAIGTVLLNAVLSSLFSCSA